MARPSEYNFDFLKQYKGIDIIYGLYLENNPIRYIGYSKNVYLRFYNHLRNHESESNIRKSNWIEKNKENIKIEILSINPKDWEKEEKVFIEKYKSNDLLNICLGGKNNRIKKEFDLLTDEEHFKQINDSLKEINDYLASKNQTKRFELFSKDEINRIINGV
jgi:GIY-YIG catalytic domain.